MLSARESAEYWVLSKRKRFNAKNLTPRPSPSGRGERGEGAFHGRSLLPILEQKNPSGWDELYASHTFHEVTMYYPMRVVRSGPYKLIWNIAHPLPFPFASDLWNSTTWQDALRGGDDAVYGKRTIRDYIHRPRFELYDLAHDADEAHNLANDPKHGKLLAELKQKIKAFQRRTGDPWILKWERE